MDCCQYLNKEESEPGVRRFSRNDSSKPPLQNTILRWHHKLSKREHKKISEELEGRQPEGGSTYWSRNLLPVNPQDFGRRRWRRILL